MFLLWVGASISVSEIFTGGLLASLGYTKGFIAIFGGHLIGTLIFALGAYVSYSRKVNAMDSVSFYLGKTVGKIIAFCNLIQLIGWIIILVVQSGGAIVEVFPGLPFWTVAFVLSILQIIWAAIFGSPGGRINDIAVVLFAGLCILFFIEAFDYKPNTINISSGINIALGIELSIAMPVSWLPLVGDYSYKANNKICGVFMPFIGYFLGSSLMYIIGFFIAISSGGDIFTFISMSKFRYIACGVILLSTITTNFVALYSAAVSSAQFLKNKNSRIPIIIIGIIVLLASVFFPINNFILVLERFLVSITMVFVPVFILVFFEHLSKRNQYTRPVNKWYLFIAIIGMAGNWPFNEYSIFIPTLMTIMLVSVLFIIKNKWPLKKGNIE
jgi:putative hydroxymethylpyrimidine transporter CytX